MDFEFLTHKLGFLFIIVHVNCLYNTSRVIIITIIYIITLKQHDQNYKLENSIINI